MLTAQATRDMNIFMMFERDPSVYSIHAIQQAISPNLKTNLLFLHAITGCDTVSALYDVGKMKAVSIIEGRNEWGMLDVFHQPSSSHEEVARVGEQFLLKLYGAVQSTSLDMLRYVLYMRQVGRKSVYSSGVNLESLPPTSAATKYHSYRAYLAVQQWSGNELAPTEWGWKVQDGRLLPVATDQPVPPDRVLRMISCGCIIGCGKNAVVTELGYFTLRCVPRVLGGHVTTANP